MRLFHWDFDQEFLAKQIQGLALSWLQYTLDLCLWAHDNWSKIEGEFSIKNHSKNAWFYQQSKSPWENKKPLHNWSFWADSDLIEPFSIAANKS